MFVYLIRHELPYEDDEVLAVEGDLYAAEEALRDLGPQERTGPRSGLRRRSGGCWEWRIEEWWVGGPTARYPRRTFVSVPADGDGICLGLEELVD